MTARIGIVVIGRNEGERLLRCLRSCRGEAATVIYVDSGSTDASVAKARELGADVVELDMSIPFTAARARNAGVARLREIDSGVEHVQFVDGDCELARGWTGCAADAIRCGDRVAAVCGRLTEQRPEASIYNHLCQMEWDGPAGVVNSCGGIAMFALEPLVAAGLFRETMIAGEEPELCFRLRGQGWKILRLDAPMATHDAAMTRMRQWMRRARRGGHAFAECFWLHRAEGFRARELSRVVGWGFVLPLLALGLAALSFMTVWASVGVGAIAGLYVLSFARTSVGRVRRGARAKDAILYSAFCMIGKFPEALGLVQFAANHLRGRRTGIIEYKGRVRSC